MKRLKTLLLLLSILSVLSASTVFAQDWQAPTNENNEWQQQPVQGEQQWQEQPAQQNSEWQQQPTVPQQTTSDGDGSNGGGWVKDPATGNWQPAPAPSTNANGDGQPVGADGVPAGQEAEVWVEPTATLEPTATSIPPTPTLALSGPALGQSLTSDRRLGIFRQIIYVAELYDLLSSPGPFTLLAPTDAAFLAMPSDVLLRLKTDTNFARRVLLHHLIKGAYNQGRMGNSGSLETNLGTFIAPTYLNGSVVINNDIEVLLSYTAGNGMLHIIDGVLSPDIGKLSSTSPNSAGNQFAQMTGGPNATITGAGQNPAYVGGGYMPYWVGIQRESGTCKGMSWVVTFQGEGTVEVGSDRLTNPWRGDMGCYIELPILCHNFDNGGPTLSRFAHNWSGGTFATTGYVYGSAITSREEGDAICGRVMGSAGWRMAEFHLSGNGAAGWNASGRVIQNLPIGERFWVAIDDQYANPWDSIVPRGAPGGNASEPITDAQYSPSFRGEGKVMEWEGKAQGRPWCKGMTMSVQKRYDGLVLVGADRGTNPYAGDSSCPSALPLLCIRVSGFAPPPSTEIDDFSEGWTGGELRSVGPVSGDTLASRSEANRSCRSALGYGWRMATFHDGALGMNGTTGWKLWGYDRGVTADERVWVGINDQSANPWNQ